MSLFQVLVFSDTVDKFHTKENEALSDQTVLRYPNFKEYLVHALKERKSVHFVSEKDLKQEETTLTTPRNQ